MIPKSVTEVIDRDGDTWVRNGDLWSFLDDDLHLDEEEVTRLYGPLRYTAPTVEITDAMVSEIYSRIDFHNHGDDGIREGLRAALEAAGFTVAGGDDRG